MIRPYVGASRRGDSAIQAVSADELALVGRAQDPVVASAWTRWAINGHFAFAAAGLDDADFERHYAADAVVVTRDSVAYGRTGFLAHAMCLRELLGDGSPTVRDLRADGTYGVAVWTCSTGSGSTVSGTDSFVVLGARIVVQTSAWVVGHAR